MKQTFLALALAFATVTPLSAEPTQERIRATITGQIDAFRAGDMARASDFASDGIRRIFGSSETFGGMVERGYAMVIAPVELRYGDLRDEAGGQVQRVLIRDAAGVWHALDYLMVEEAEGWRIGGVELLGPPEVGA
ncbi:MAG: DUF4864 domain-containing protein [Maritimibacter sp.]|nr:DUF4864 domain-containing protein [Maritimibacter sp.]